MSQQGDHEDLSSHQQALAEYLQELLNDVEEYQEPGEAEPDPEEAPAPLPVAEDDDPFADYQPDDDDESADGDDDPSPEWDSVPESPAPAVPEPAAPEPPRTRVRERERLPEMPMPAPPPSEPEPEPEPTAVEPEAAPTRRKTPTPAPGKGGGGAAAKGDGVPDWAKPSFQALLFTVGNLRLAVPLVKLHSVVPWESMETEPLPSQPQWMDGLCFYRGRHVRVVNTAELVLPAERRPDPETLRPRKLLVVGDATWALSCRDVEDVITLQPTQVQWRSPQGRRRWLSGTVREHLCALMDTDAFAELLEAEGGDIVSGGMVPGADSGQND